MNKTQLVRLGLRIRDFIVDDCYECLCHGPTAMCMAGACALATRTMQLTLDELGHDSNLVMGRSNTEGHCWLELGLNGQYTVVDCTADQFWCMDREKPCAGLAPDHVVVLSRANYNRLPFAGMLKHRIKNERALAHINHKWYEQAPASYTGLIDEFVAQIVQEDWLR